MPKRDAPKVNRAKSALADLVYAVPSYKRHDIIGAHTLKMLADNGIDPKVIYIFVSSPEEMAAYKKQLGEKYHLIMAQSENVVQKFNFIHGYFPEDQKVVVIEDDILMLKKKIGENKLAEFTGLNEMAEASFEACRKHITKLWGISSNANPFYMDDRMSVGFKFVVANLYGFIATKNHFLEVSQICKSDYERTMLYYVMYGAVVRNDGVCAITKNYQTPGGLQEMLDRAEIEEQSCRALVKRFPHLVQINEKKSKISKYMELKFLIQKKNQSVDLRALQKILDAKK